MKKIHSHLIEINESLEANGFFTKENLISPEFCESLLDFLMALKKQNKFSDAGIVQLPSHASHETIRSSEIYWIDDWAASDCLPDLHAGLKEVMTSLNRHFFLSLKSIEAQFAVYEKGGFYKKHIDKPKKENHRQVTLTLYLTDSDEGGELVIYKQGSKNEVAAVVGSKKGSVVMFLSDQIYHEVKPTVELRCSLTVWFRSDGEI